METLIIILIVAMIAQTCVFIYANFIDNANNRAVAANNEIVKVAQQRFLQDTETYKKNLEAKDEILKQWIDNYNKCAAELDEARKVNWLLKNRTACIEGLKDSICQVAEYSWDLRKCDPTKDGQDNRQCFAEGVKVGAEWLAECVGVKVKFELDGRFDKQPNPPSFEESQGEKKEE